MDEEKVMNQFDDEVALPDESAEVIENTVTDETAETTETAKATEVTESVAEATSSVVPEDVVSKFESDPEYNVEVDVATIEEEAEKEAELIENTKAEMKNKFALWQKNKEKKKSKLYKAIGVGTALVIGGIAIGVYLSNKDK